MVLHKEAYRGADFIRPRMSEVATAASRLLRESLTQ